MVEILEQKKYPAVSIQSVLLGTNLIYLEKGAADMPLFISIVLVLILFTLQALNPRFLYYFPRNGFTGKRTYQFDTYILYAMTAFAFLFTTLGIFKSPAFSIVSTLLIVGLPVFWRNTFRLLIRERLTDRFKKETHEFPARCPSCGGEAKVVRKVLDWDKGLETWVCLGKCGKEGEVQLKPIEIG